MILKQHLNLSEGQLNAIRLKRINAQYFLLLNVCVHVFIWVYICECKVVIVIAYFHVNARIQNALTNYSAATLMATTLTWTHWQMFYSVLTFALTFRNRIDNTIFHSEQSMSASSVSSTSNIVDNVRDSTYRPLSLYTDRISVESISHIMLLRVSMQFYHYYMYCWYTMLKLLWSMMIFLVLLVKPNQRK